MSIRKNKGQISVEALIIVGVLVIGGVVFAAVYLGNIGEQAKRGNDLSAITDDFMNDLGGWGTPGNPGTPSQTFCNGGGCNAAIGENCTSCAADCGGCITASCTDPIANCGLGTCPPCAPSGTLIIGLKLNPASSNPVNTKFLISVLMTNATGRPNEVLKSIEIRKSGATTDKCSFNGTYASSFNNLKIPFNGTREMALEFSCKEDGNYSFSIEAGILNDATPEYNDTKNITKEITPATTPVCGNTVCESGESCPTCPECCTTPAFTVLITSPAENKMYFNNQNIQLTAIEKDGGSTGLVCEWFIGEKYIPANKSCNYTFSLDSVGIGEQKVSVYATKEVGGVTTSSKDEKTIKVYKHDPAAIYLSDIGTQLVGKEFNIQVSSLNQTSVNSTSVLNISFLGTTCTIDSTKVSGVLTDNINGTPIYYKLFPTTCTQARYSAADVLDQVNAIFSSTNYPFYVGYDTSLNFASCGSGGSNNGLLNVCVLQSSGGNYNADYWNSQYGLLKIKVDAAKETNTSNFGELKIYIE